MAGFVIAGCAFGDLPPLEARPGNDRQTTPGTTVRLDASASTGPEGEELAFHWTLEPPPGSAAILSAADTAVATFVPDVVGRYVATLTVATSTAESAPARVTIAVVPAGPGERPIALAGGDLQVGRHTYVALDGGASRSPAGRPLTYAWALEWRPPRSAALLDSATVPTPSFVTDEPGEYALRLVVHDGEQASEPSRLFVTATNAPPVPRIVASPRVALGTPATLDGSTSSDLDRDALIHAWTLLSQPAGSRAALASTTGPTTSLTPDVAGPYAVQLVVGDGYGSSPPVQVIIEAAPSPDDLPPVARATAPAEVSRGTHVLLDGTGSSDPEGRALTWNWALETRPPRSLAQLSDAMRATAALTPDLAGEYVVRLLVSDGVNESAPLRLSIVARNTRPAANAGADLVVAPRATALLSGHASRDPDGDTLSFRWGLLARPPGAVVSITDATGPVASFSTDLPGRYEVELVVDDGELSSLPDVVHITVPGNAAPVANAGGPRTVARGALVFLDGAASADPEGGPLTWSWEIESGPAGTRAQLSSLTSPSTSLRPDKPGAYVVRLAVNDGHQWSVPARATITATNVRPVARAGNDRLVIRGLGVRLSGAESSDEEGDPLSWTWALVKRPTGSAAALAGSLSSSPLLIPDLVGEYVVELRVHDGYDESEPATVRLTAHHNEPPVARLTPDRTAARGLTVALDGRASSDPEGAALTYQWSFESRPSGSSSAFTGAGSATPSFVPSVPGAYVVRLVVSDGVASSAPATQAITVLNNRPVANAGPDVSVSAGLNTTLTGSAIDADQDSITLAWRVVETPDGAKATLSSMSSTRPVFRTDLPGTYVVELIARDPWESGPPDTVAITVVPNLPPLADAGADRVVARNSYVELDARRSSDPEGAPLTYSWRLESRPTSSTTTLSHSGYSYVQLVPDVPGTYVVQLVVHDGLQSSAPAKVTITVPNVRPVANAGADQIGWVPRTLALDGTRSSDPDRSPIVHRWTVVQRPAGSVSALEASTSATPRLALDVPGTYELELVVNDGTDDSLPDRVVLTAYREAVFTTPRPLGFLVTDAEYSRALDQLVLVSANPHRLHLYEGRSGVAQTVDLPLAPTSISVSPDGRSAAVGHDAWVSKVDLVTRQVEQTVAVPFRVTDLALSATHAYAVPAPPESGLATVDFTIRRATVTATGEGGAAGRVVLHASGTKVYTRSWHQNGSQSLARYDLGVGGPARVAQAVSTAACSELWATIDGYRLLTRCATALRTSDDPAFDLAYNGTLPGLVQVAHADASPDTDRLLAIDGANATMLREYAYAFLTLDRPVALPPMQVGGVSYAASGRWIFFAADGTQAFVILQAVGSGLLHDMAVTSLEP